MQVLLAMFWCELVARCPPDIFHCSVECLLSLASGELITVHFSFELLDWLHMDNIWQVSVEVDSCLFRLAVVCWGWQLVAKHLVKMSNSSDQGITGTLILKF